MTQPAGTSTEQLIPRRYRPAAAAAVGACALILAVTAALVAHHRWPTRLDAAFWNRLPYPWQTGGVHGAGFEFLTTMDQVRVLGGELAITFLTVLLCYCCLALRRPRAAIVVAAGELLASGLTTALKPVIGRKLGHSLSFPSGHTTAAFALAVAVVLILASSREGRMPRSMRVALSVVALAMAALVALAMVAWHLHYLTDTFGGAAIGIGVPLGIALLVDVVADRRARQPQRAQATEAEPAGQLS